MAGCEFNRQLEIDKYLENKEAHGERYAREYLKTNMEHYRAKENGQKVPEWLVRVGEKGLMTADGQSLLELTEKPITSRLADRVSSEIKGRVPVELETLRYANDLARSGAETIIIPEHVTENGRLSVGFVTIYRKDASNPSLYHGSQIALGENVGVSVAREKIKELFKSEKFELIQSKLHDAAFVLKMETHGAEKIQTPLQKERWFRQPAEAVARDYKRNDWTEEKFRINLRPQEKWTRSRTLTKPEQRKHVRIDQFIKTKENAGLTAEKKSLITKFREKRRKIRKLLERENQPKIFGEGQPRVKRRLKPEVRSEKFTTFGPARAQRFVEEKVRPKAEQPFIFKGKIAEIMVEKARIFNRPFRKVSNPDAFETEKMQIGRTLSEARPLLKNHYEKFSSLFRLEKTKKTKEKAFFLKQEAFKIESFTRIQKVKKEKFLFKQLRRWLNLAESINTGKKENLSEPKKLTTEKKEEMRVQKIEKIVGFKEKKKIRMEKTAELASAIIFWLLIVSESKKPLPKMETLPKAETKNQELTKLPETPWVLLAIIRYLNLLREGGRGQNQNPKKKKKAKIIKKTNFLPRQAIIFTAFS